MSAGKYVDGVTCCTGKREHTAVYVGGLDAAGAPHGAGVWSDSYEHGEFFVGCATLCARLAWPARDTPMPPVVCSQYPDCCTAPHPPPALGSATPEPRNIPPTAHPLGKQCCGTTAAMLEASDEDACAAGLCAVFKHDAMPCAGGSTTAPRLHQ